MKNLDITQLEKDKVSPAFLFACYYKQEHKTELINIYGTMWTREVTPFLQDCKKYGIEEFTINETGTMLMELLDEFDLNDCEVVQFTRINYGEYKVPALKLKIN